MQTSISFNLVDEPWLPLRRLDGPVAEVSLRECLSDPGAFTSPTSTNPTEYFAILRLLLAVSHRAVGPGRPKDRQALLANWPAMQVNQYLDTHRDRFDLFHPERPFMQVAGLAGAGLAPSHVNRIVLDRSAGNTKMLFDHGGSAAMAAAGAARTLIGHLQFTPGGLVKALRTAGSAGAASSMLVVLPVGASLQQTLALSLLPQSAGDHAVDLPPWEVAEPSIEELARGNNAIPVGPVQRYTWLSRALLLMPLPDGSVRELLYAEGLPLDGGPVPDPMSITVNSAKGAFPLKVSIERAFWREFDALAGSARGVPPAVIENAVAMTAASGDYDAIDLVAGGLLTDKAKLLLWRLEERRITPRVLALASEEAALVCSAIAMADEAGFALKTAFDSLAHAWLEGDAGVNKAAVTALVAQLNGMPTYWILLEPRFWAFVQALGCEGEQAAYEAWRASVEAAVRQSWRSTTVRLGRSGRALAAAARTERLMWKAVAVSRAN